MSLAKNDAPPAQPGAASGQTRAPGETEPTARVSAAPETRGSELRAATAPDADPGAAVRSRTVLDDLGIRRCLMRIAHEIVESYEDLSRLYLVGIPNGGVPLARILIQNISSIADREVPLGILDTTLYRDDLTTRGHRPPLRVTEMPSSVDDRIVILVEDVVNTGRTIRAAMDALMDFGRPSQVRVVALIDRGHRELPIKIDYVGKNIPTRPGDRVSFRGEAGSYEGALEVVVESGRRQRQLDRTSGGGRAQGVGGAQG